MNCILSDQPLKHKAYAEYFLISFFHLLLTSFPFLYQTLNVYVLFHMISGLHESKTVFDHSISLHGQIKHTTTLLPFLMRVQKKQNFLGRDVCRYYVLKTGINNNHWFAMCVKWLQELQSRFQKAFVKDEEGTRCANNLAKMYQKIS